MRINFQFKFLIVLILVLIFMNIFMPFITMAVDEEFYDPREFDNGDYNTLSDTTIGNKNLSIKSVLTRFFSLALNIVRIISLSWAILMAFAIAIKYMTGSTGIKAQISLHMLLVQFFYLVLMD